MPAVYNSITTTISSDQVFLYRDGSARCDKAFFRARNKLARLERNDISDLVLPFCVYRVKWSVARQVGATTFNIMALIVTTLSITGLTIITLSITTLSTKTLSITSLSTGMLSVSMKPIMLSVVMLKVAAPSGVLPAYATNETRQLIFAE